MKPSAINQTWRQWAQRSRDPSHSSVRLAWRTLPPLPRPPPVLTRASGRGFPETQLGGAQRTAVRAAPDAPDERERRELEASTCSEPCVHDTSKQTHVRARAHTYTHSSAIEEEEQPPRSNMSTSAAARPGSNASLGSG